MRILRQIIEKKMELSNEYILNRQYLRGIWQFYCCYNLALAILCKEVKDIRLMNKLWRRWIIKENIFDEKKFKKIKEFMNKDMGVIIEAIGFITKQEEKNPYEFGSIDRDWAVGMLSWEVPT